MHMSLALPFILMHFSLSIMYFALICSLVIVPMAPGVITLEVVLELLGAVDIDVWLCAENAIAHRPSMNVLKRGLIVFI